MNALQVVLNIGARVIVSDTRQACLDTARSLGVPVSDIVPPTISPQEFVRDNGLTNKIDTVLDFVGAHQTFEDAQHIGKLCIGPFLSSPTNHAFQSGEGARCCVSGL